MVLTSACSQIRKYRENSKPDADPVVAMSSATKWREFDVDVRLYRSFRMKRSWCIQISVNGVNLEGYACHLGHLNGFFEFKLHP